MNKRHGYGGSGPEVAYPVHVINTQTCFEGKSAEGLQHDGTLTKTFLSAGGGPRARAMPPSLPQFGVLLLSAVTCYILGWVHAGIGRSLHSHFRGGESWHGMRVHFLLRCFKGESHAGSALCLSSNPISALGPLHPFNPKAPQLPRVTYLGETNIRGLPKP